MFFQCIEYNQLFLKRLQLQKRILMHMMRMKRKTRLLALLMVPQRPPKVLIQLKVLFQLKVGCHLKVLFKLKVGHHRPSWHLQVLQLKVCHHSPCRPLQVLKI